MKASKINKKALFIALTAVLLLVTVGTTVAFLITKSDTVSNEFTPTKVTCKVEETFDGNVKQDVCVRNTGDIDAFIRAGVIFNWVNDTDGKVHPTTPKENTDYTIVWGQTGWQKGADGFMYHLTSVAPGTITADLIESVTPINTPDGYSLQVQILATAIQSAPETAAEDAWDVIVTHGNIIP